MSVPESVITFANSVIPYTYQLAYSESIVSGPNHLLVSLVAHWFKKNSVYSYPFPYIFYAEIFLHCPVETFCYRFCFLLTCSHQL